MVAGRPRTTTYGMNCSFQLNSIRAESALGASTKSADTSTSMAGMNMPDMNMNAGASAAPSISPELSMPYGFPTPGHYRLFLQFKRANKIETAYFDTAVN
jgi:hypothetical protein